jgi:hypothetical protein
MNWGYQPGRSRYATCPWCRQSFRVDLRRGTFPAHGATPGSPRPRCYGSWISATPDWLAILADAHAWGYWPEEDEQNP